MLVIYLRVSQFRSIHLAYQKQGIRKFQCFSLSLTKQYFCKQIWLYCHSGWNTNWTTTTLVAVVSTLRTWIFILSYCLFWEKIKSWHTYLTSHCLFMASFHITRIYCKYLSNVLLALSLPHTLPFTNTAFDPGKAALSYKLHKHWPPWCCQFRWCR